MKLVSNMTIDVPVSMIFSYSCKIAKPLSLHTQLASLCLPGTLGSHPHCVPSSPCPLSPSPGPTVTPTLAPPHASAPPCRSPAQQLCAEAPHGLPLPSPLLQDGTCPTMQSRPLTAAQSPPRALGIQPRLWSCLGSSLSAWDFCSSVRQAPQSGGPDAEEAVALGSEGSGVQAQLCHLLTRT